MNDTLHAFQPWVTHASYAFQPMASFGVLTDQVLVSQKFLATAQEDSKDNPALGNFSRKRSGIVTLFGDCPATLDDDPTDIVSTKTRTHFRDPHSLHDEDACWLKLYWDQRNLKGLRKEVDRLLRIFPNSPELHYYSGLHDLEKEHVDWAVESFERAVALDPDEAKYQAYLAWALHHTLPLKKKKGGEAQAVDFRMSERIITGLKKALSVEPKDALWRYFLGQHYADLGLVEPARYYLRTALHLDPNHVKTLVALSRLELQDCNDELAMSFLMKIIVLRPQDIYAWVNAAEVYRRGECYEEAIACYLKLVKLQPRFKAEYYFRIADCYERLKQFETAYWYYEQVRELTPENYLAVARLLDLDAKLDKNLSRIRSEDN